MVGSCGFLGLQMAEKDKSESFIWGTDWFVDGFEVQRIY